MVKKLLLFCFLGFLINPEIIGQQEAYSVKLAPFSSNKYDEFSPVYYKNGIVFCTNRKSGSLADYSSSKGKGTFKIYYVDTTVNVNWRKAHLFSRSLKTHFNDGPVTFDSDFDTIYYSRNLRTEGKLQELSTTRNKLGIFTAVKDGKKWDKIHELRFNNEYYNISTPYLSQDGKRLYFASDKPNGFGGSDIYYSDWKGDYWNDPINLGPEINTKGNESYPFITPAGELFFSSDGQPGGYGGKDIYFTRLRNDKWLQPIRLDAPINSKLDDFGFITDSVMTSGFLSSNREKTIDIYCFKVYNPQLFYCEEQKNNKYCYNIRDDGNTEIDPINLEFQWDFLGNDKELGNIVSYCFPGPGKYVVKENIVEKNNGRIVFNKLSYELNLKAIEQPFINCGENALRNDTLNFDANKSNLSNYETLKYSWDFGDGNRAIGNVVKHAFTTPGEYSVKLGLILKETSSGKIHQNCVSKRIYIGSASDELVKPKPNFVSDDQLPQITEDSMAYISYKYYYSNELERGAVFQVELLSSRSKIDFANKRTFISILSKYTVKEIFTPESNTYSYIIDEETNIMNAYMAYKDAISNGFDSARIKTYIYTDPAEKELIDLKKVYGICTDAFFYKSDYRITSEGFAILDQLLLLLKKYPRKRLSIGIHSDNSGSPSLNLQLSQYCAQNMANYLINKGINSKRLNALGYGGSRPINSNNNELNRKKNRRVEFILLN
jgi:outer membrane protein OmpA-like peptidoglycan-associated protein